jgi:hypothetical protein
LFFAIAGDSPEDVSSLLRNGDSSPNETCGHHTALAFAASNHKLVNRGAIVAVLLAHGANPSDLESLTDSSRDTPVKLDPYIQYAFLCVRPSILAHQDNHRYLIGRARSARTRQATFAIAHIPRYSPLKQLSFGIVGQDLLIDEFYRAIAMNELTSKNSPLVFILCGKVQSKTSQVSENNVLS